MDRSCPSCAIDVSPRANECPRCGTSLTGAADPGPDAPSPDRPDAGGAGTDVAGTGAGARVPAPHAPGRGGDTPGASAVPGPPPGDPSAAPQATGTALESSVRNWAMIAHLAAYSVFFVPVPVIGPVIVWSVKREDHPFIDYHGKESINFNLSILIYGIVAAVSMLLLVGFILLPLVFLFWFIVTIIAGLKAAGGEWYRYPLTIRFLN